MKLLFCAAAALCLAAQAAAGGKADMDGLPRLEPASDRRFTFTNKLSSFYMGGTHEANSSGFEGWTVDEFRWLAGYTLYFGGRAAGPADIASVRLYPDKIVRAYKNGLTETMGLLDGRDALYVRVGPAARLAGAELEAEGAAGRWRKPLDRRGTAMGGARGRVIGLDITPDNGGATALFVVAADTDTLSREMDGLRGQVPGLAAQRAARMAALLARQDIKTDDARWQAALRWASLSMDSLVVDQWGPGIWAGLPWFNNYWGRDSFISFTGAVVTSGQFPLARDILRSFAKFQLTDQASPDYGRIPNRVTNNETIYNTSDGSLWFVLALNAYLNYSGDADFAAEMLPVVERIIRGGLRRTDGRGFLKHGDAETWMDAVGPSGPWTPRGDRAVDIQALWYAALTAGAGMAGGAPEAADWRAAAEKLRSNFTSAYFNKDAGLFYDHLNADGSPDAQDRPNQFFVFAAPDLAGAPALADAALLEPAMRKAAAALVYPYGVVSLDPADRNFHPYHEYPPYYPKDAAYHNGVIWTWLAGPVIRTLAHYGQADLAARLYSAEARQVLTRDAAGGMSELLEAWPRPGEAEPRISGTVTQAWDLAEFNRNFVEDIAGYRPDALHGRALFVPMAGGYKDISLRLPYRRGFIGYRCEAVKGGYRLHFDTAGLADPVEVTASMGGAERHIELKPGTSVRVLELPAAATAASWSFAEPEPRTDLPVFAKVDYQLLAPETVYYPAPAGRPLALKAEGPALKPCGNYAYPTDTNFKEGILDLDGIIIRDEGDSWGFEVRMKGLWDPAWHPEYGFQLTYLAIAIGDGSGRREVGMEANFSLPEGRGYDRIIYAGGGLELHDGSGRTLASYVPQDNAHHLGFIADKAVRFRLPKAMLPALAGPAVMSVMAGAQDDHGGAGLGNFRPVKTKAGQWNGGGAASDDGAACRVYSALYIKK